MNNENRQRTVSSEYRSLVGRAISYKFRDRKKSVFSLRYFLLLFIFYFFIFCLVIVHSRKSHLLSKAMIATAEHAVSVVKALLGTFSSFLFSFVTVTSNHSLITPECESSDRVSLLLAWLVVNSSGTSTGHPPPMRPICASVLHATLSAAQTFKRIYVRALASFVYVNCHYWRHPRPLRKLSQRGPKGRLELEFSDPL